MSLLKPRDKRCVVCQYVMPVAQFGTTEGGRLHDICLECLEVARASKVRDKSKDIIEKQMDEVRQELMEERVNVLVEATARERIEAPHISELCEGIYAEMLAMWGKETKASSGLQAFSRKFVTFFSKLMEDADGKTVTALQKMFMSVVQLTKLSTEFRKSAPDMEHFTEEEFREFVAGVARTVISDDALLEEARQRGLRIFDVDRSA